MHARLGLDIITAKEVRMQNRQTLSTVAIVSIILNTTALSAGAQTAQHKVGQSAAGANQKFEVASVKPCRIDEMPRGGRGSVGGSSDPGRVSVGCRTVKMLIELAYLRFANGVGHSPEEISLTPIEGGPAWIDSEQYTIDARPEGPQSPEIMRGPMLQTLLEDRFQLQLHRETREVPVYELTVAKGGPKLQRSQVGSCIPNDWTKASAPPRAPDETRNPCRTRITVNEGIATLEAQQRTVGEFSRILSLGGQRPVIDKTGITGLYDFHLVYVEGMTAPTLGVGDAGGLPETTPAGVSGAPSIVTALKELGLKLEQAKGPREFLVIDHVERPSKN